MQEQVNLKEEGVNRMHKEVQQVKRVMEKAKRKVQQECQEELEQQGESLFSS